LSLTKDQLENLFTPEVLRKLLPADRADRFFEALFGDSGEGAFDLGLGLKRLPAGGKETPYGNQA
jgi:hypothetical protein